MIQPALLLGAFVLLVRGGTTAAGETEKAFGKPQKVKANHDEFSSGKDRTQKRGVKKEP